MLKVYQAETDEDRAHIRELFWEYLQWANTKVNEEFRVNFDIEQMLKEDMLDLEKFYPPHGCLLLAEIDDRVAGLACMRKIRNDIGEIKRMYVREEYRGLGIGINISESMMPDVGCSDRQNVALLMTNKHVFYEVSLEQFLFD